MNKEIINKIFNEDCIVGMGNIADNSVEMILTDLPYGVTNCHWDSVIDFDMLWLQYNRILKDNGVVVLTSVQPFTTDVINSNRKNFKYCWYWKKNASTGFAFAKYQPMRCVEDIVVFYKHMPKYNPQGLVKLDKPIVDSGRRFKDGIYKSSTLNKPHISKYTNYPKHILEFKCERGLHSTQKPVALFEYLIQTYTNVGDTVVDSCIGSGTTAVAAINTGRNFIGFEKDKAIFDVAVERINMK